MNRLIVDHLNSTRLILQSYSSHFSNAKHSDILGYCREAIINEFLAKHCPSIIEYSTGEIIDSVDKRSGQVDIIMQTNSSPKIPLYENRQLSFADTVLGAIEVKSSLTTANIEATSHLKLALDNILKIKKLDRLVEDPYHKNIPCFIIAFKGPLIETLISFIVKYSKKNQIPISEFCPEVISVIDKGYSLSKNDGFISTKKEGELIKWDSESSMSLAIPFIYISRKVETWSQQPKLMNFLDYFKSS